VEYEEQVKQAKGVAKGRVRRAVVVKRAGTDRRIGVIHHAGVVLALMFCINVVNYLDRFVASAVGPTLKLEFHLTDADIGFLTTAFLLIYTVAGLPLGLLADRASRPKIVAVGVAIWSVFSAYTAFARTFAQLFISRAGVGIGEASYLPAGTALLSGYFRTEKRARVMSVWGAGQIVGVALAFIVSAVLFFVYKDSPFFAWRLAFFVTALPGLALALIMWFVADTPHTKDASTSATASGHGTLSGALSGGWRAAREMLQAVLRIRTVRVIVVLQALYFIVTTPAVVFFPIYIQSPTGPFRLSPAQVSLVSGVMLVVGGLSGMLAGGHVADWLGRRFGGSRVLTAAVGCGLALPCYVIALLVHNLPLFMIFGTIAIFAFNLQAGPLTAAIQDATPPVLRSTAVAVTLLLAHLFGDIWAPTVVGAISTALHEQSGLALLVVGVPVLVASVVVAFFGARIYAADAAHERAEEEQTHVRRAL
jgi:MFS family permease